MNEQTMITYINFKKSSFGFSLWGFINVIIQVRYLIAYQVPEFVFYNSFDL